MLKKSIILDGRIVRAELKKALIEKVRAVSKPCLAIVQVGDRADSNFFISAKKKFAQEIGVEIRHIRLPEISTQKDVVAVLENLDNDVAVHGIIVQLPLPISMDKDAVLAVISPKKDVDGLGAVNVQKWFEGRSDAVWPATVRGIRELLRFYNISLEGKKVVVIGRSSLVGKPVAAMCLGENATVIVCHSKTENLAEHTHQADVVIVAIGKPHTIGTSHVRTGQIVIDIGTSDVKGLLTGDVDFEAVKDIVAAITPVPGGVGQMTVLALFENLIDTFVL